jgi:glycosyltransferase involved in cell wall biosynthesis
VVLKVSNDLVRRDLPAPIRAIYRCWLRIQGHFINHFVGLAAPMRAEIGAAMRVDLSRVAVIEDPALDAAGLSELAAIGAERTPGGSRRYVAVGRLSGQKNMTLLVNAFAQAADPGDTLTIVGEGADRPKIERQITRLGLDGRVALPGHGAVAPALAAADVFVLSSDYEGVPAVVIEALSSGLPIVATDCSVSMASLIAGFGELVPVGNAAALAAAMRRARPLDAAARASAAAAMQSFTVEVAAGRYAALFAAMFAAAR